jgi:hypothetical protein
MDGGEPAGLVNIDVNPVNPQWEPRKRSSQVRGQKLIMPAVETRRIIPVVGGIGRIPGAVGTWPDVDPA